MKNNYEFCIKELLKSEGGYSNNPNDKGGPTNFGITLTDYRLYINKNGTADDVKSMSVDQALSIYKTKYWDALDCNNLPPGVDYTVFDYGVNSGVARAKKILLGFSNIKDNRQLINAICDERLAFMKRIRGGQDWKVFGKGWSARVERVRSDSLKLTKSTVTPVVATTGGAIAIGTAASYHWPNMYAPWIAIAVISIVVASILGYTVYKYVKEVKNV